MLDGSELTADGQRQITIPGAKLTDKVLTITVEKVTQRTLAVDVSEYVIPDGTTMWLVTASESKTLAYNGTPMFWSEMYDAYAFLVFSDKAVASYDFDVNETGLIDIDDAQLVYDMYNAKYDPFDKVAVIRFLKADCNGDRVLYLLDSAAIMNRLMQG